MTLHRRVSVATFAGLFFLFPLVSVLANKGVVPLFLTAAVLATGAERWGTGRWPRPERTLAIVLGAVLLWQGVASAWTFDPERAGVLALRLGSLYLAALLTAAVAAEFGRNELRLVCRWGSAGLLAAILLMAVEYLDDGALYRAIHEPGPVASYPSRLNRGATAVAILIIPVAGWLWSRGLGRRALLLPVAGIGFLWLYLSNAAVVALSVGTLALVLSYAGRRAAAGIALAVLVVGLIGMPLIAKQFYAAGLHARDDLPGSIAHRVHIWNYATDRFLQRPVVGWGFDAARNLPDDDRPLWRKSEIGLMPLHPHNGPLQVALELGSVGLALVALPLVVLIRRIDRLPGATERAFATGTFSAIFVVASTAFGIWQSAWITTILATVLFVQICAASRTAPAATGRRQIEPETGRKGAAARVSGPTLR